MDLTAADHADRLRQCADSLARTLSGDAERQADAMVELRRILLRAAAFLDAGPAPSPAAVRNGDAVVMRHTSIVGRHGREVRVEFRRRRVA